MALGLRRKQFIYILSLFALLFTAGAVHAQTQAESRILSPIKNEERFTVAGSTSPLLKASVDNGRMTGGQNLGRMLLMLSPTAEQDQQAARFDRLAARFVLAFLSQVADTRAIWPAIWRGRGRRHESTAVAARARADSSRNIAKPSLHRFQRHGGPSGTSFLHGDAHLQLQEYEVHSQFHERSGSRSPGAGGKRSRSPAQRSATS